MPTGMSNSSASCQNGSNRESWGEIPSYCGESSPNALIRPDSSFFAEPRNIGKICHRTEAGPSRNGSVPAVARKNQSRNISARIRTCPFREIIRQTRVYKQALPLFTTGPAFQILTVRRKQATKIESIMRKLNMLVAFASVLTFVSSSTAAQSSIDGHWEGVMVRQGSELIVSFDFSDGATGIFNSPTLKALGIPLLSVTYSAPNVHFLLVGDFTTIIFDGQLSGSMISGQFREGADRGGQFREGDAGGGVFREGEAKGTFSLRRAEAKKPTFTEEEVIFRNGDVTLSGTLLLPLTKGPHPAIVFLHGSGAEGRQATRFFAEYFTDRGMATLISDKRGVGKSTGDWHRSDFGDLADDAIAGIRFLQQRKEIDATKIGIYGHSQGGMIAPLVASRIKDVAFVISSAGHALPLYEGEINSITNQVRARGISGNDLAEATDFIKMWHNVARTGEGWEQFDAAMEKARATNWFRAIRVPPKDDWTWAFFKRIYDYNAADYWAKVTVAVFVMYGEKDLFTPVSQSISNIDQALKKAGNKDYTIIVFPRASHTLDIEPDAGQPFEWRRMAPGFPDLLMAWLQERIK